MQSFCSGLSNGMRSVEQIIIKIQIQNVGFRRIVIILFKKIIIIENKFKYIQIGFT